MGLEVFHQLFERKLLNLWLGLVRAAFGKSVPTLTKPFTPSGPSNRPTLKEPLTQNPSRKVGRRSLKEPCEDQKTISVPPWNLTRGSRIGYETLRALCKFRPSCKGCGSLVSFPPEPSDQNQEPFRTASFFRRSYSSPSHPRLLLCTSVATESAR